MTDYEAHERARRNSELYNDILKRESFERAKARRIEAYRMSIMVGLADFFGGRGEIVRHSDPTRYRFNRIK